MKTEKLISNIPNGYSEWIYQGKKYGISKTEFNSGRSIKVYAEELGGSNFISFNFYRMSSGNKLKPCEMPEQKVLDFIADIELTT